MFDLAGVKIALHGEDFSMFREPISAETGLPETPIVVRFFAAGMQSAIAIEGRAVNAKVKILAEFVAVTKIGKTVQESAAAGAHERALRIARGFGDDVDDAIDGVGTPERATRAGDYFDAIDVFEHEMLNIPEDSREKWGIDAAAVDIDEQFVGGGGVEAAATNGPLVRIYLGDLKVGRETKSLRERGRTGTSNILAGDDLNGRSGFRKSFRLA